MYFSGQGKLFVAALTANGLPGAFRWLGNVPDFAPKFETSKIEHKESYTGQRLTDANITTESKLSVSATIEDWSRENLAMVTRGEAITTTSGTVVDEASPAVLAVGDIWALKNQNVSVLSIKDSSAVPVTISAANYTLDPAFGTVVLKAAALTGATLPLKASYTKGITDVVAFFTKGINEVALRFEGVNTADGNKKVLVEIYRVALDPTQELGLITKELGQFKMAGNTLIDNTKADDPLFGKFGRMLYLA